MTTEVPLEPGEILIDIQRPNPTTRKVIIMKKFFAAIVTTIALAIPITAIAVAGDPAPMARGGYGDWPV